MIFVDTNAIMYAVGREHPLRAEAQAFFAAQVDAPEGLVSSAEVLQELLHAYLPVDRLETLEAAFTLIEATILTIWAIEPDDVYHARVLAGSNPGLGARDLLHLSCCQRRGVDRIQTFDRALRAAFG
ncbi:MAG TPA: type II toxin-antitoxin system VapC family toxin [Thermoanaerobaculia bacterium]|nr:type II toxin-antitoxin system VapC family toxin [Thermoanaerobaculia bacterium]